VPDENNVAFTPNEPDKINIVVVFVVVANNEDKFMMPLENRQQDMVVIKEVKFRSKR